MSAANADDFQVDGQVLFSPYVYRSVSGLGSPPYDAGDARVAEHNILRFLRSSGYSLARVRAATRDGKMIVEVDEGRLARIRLLGRGTFATLGLRIDLDMPESVFNRFALEDRLAEIEHAAGEDPPSYQILEVEAQQSILPLETLAWVPGVAPVLLPTEARYELRVTLPPSLFGVGARIRVGADSDGVLAGLGYRGRALLWGEDRWELRSGAGINFFRGEDGNGRTIAFSRAELGGTYWLPDWFLLRPRLALDGSIVRRQRFDIGVPEY
ncbi:MAG: hypothetical protein AAFQ82_21875, partial [Myxococcota bacterium]